MREASGAMLAARSMTLCCSRMLLGSRIAASIVPMPRETPLHLSHVLLMAQATAAGAVLVPPLPAFYHRPRTLEDVIMQSVDMAHDQFDPGLDLFRRRMGNEEREAAPGR